MKKTRLIYSLLFFSIFCGCTGEVTHSSNNNNTIFVTPTNSIHTNNSNLTTSATTSQSTTQTTTQTTGQTTPVEEVINIRPVENTFVLENESTKLVLTNLETQEGTLLVSTSFQYKGREILKNNTTFANLFEKDGTRHKPKRATLKTDNVLNITFYDTPISIDVQADIKKRYITFTLISIDGDLSNLSKIDLGGLPPKDELKYGGASGIAFDDDIVFGRIALTRNAQINWANTSAYKKFGFLNVKFAFFVSAKKNAYAYIHDIETQNNIPNSSIDGISSKSHPDIRRGYLFADLKMDNIDAIISNAKKANLKYILIFRNTWVKSSGTYTFNTENFPNGERDLKKLVDRIHAAKLKVGLHFLGLRIDKEDPFATSSTLKKKDGSPLELNGGYIVDLSSSLVDKITTRLADIAANAGVDMLYFDGGEWATYQGGDAERWYWWSAIPMGVLEKVLAKNPTQSLLIEGSGYVPWSWHAYSRGVSFDYAAIATKNHFEESKLLHRRGNDRNFLPGELGWWGFQKATPNYPATTYDEIEYHAARMIAYDSPIGIETHLEDMQKHGNSDAYFKQLSKWENLRLHSSFPDDLREKLKKGDWHLELENSKPAFYPREYSTHVFRTSNLGKVNIVNKYTSQPLSFRLQALPKLDVTNPENKTLYDGSLLLPVPPLNADMPGYLSETLSYSPKANLNQHRALAITLKTTTQVNSPASILNIQMIYADRFYRDYFLPLDFSGTRTVLLVEPETKELFGELKPHPKNYEAHQSTHFVYKYRYVQGLNLRWMRVNGTPNVEVQKISAVKEIDVPLQNPKFTNKGQVIEFPVVLNRGDFLIYEGQGNARHYDENYNFIEEVKPRGTLQLDSGNQSLSFSAVDENEALAKIVIITQGPKEN